MNIDQRLEALTHTLELVASMQTAREMGMAELTARTAKLEESGAKLQQPMATLAGVMAQLHAW